MVRDRYIYLSILVAALMTTPLAATGEVRSIRSQITTSPPLTPLSLRRSNSTTASSGSTKCEVPMIIRDFRKAGVENGHPDFGFNNRGHQTGAVEKHLVNGVPVLSDNGATSLKSNFTTKENFSKWYTDSSYSQRADVFLSFEKGENLSFTNGNFFPVDHLDKNYHDGHSDSPHNFYFTTHVSLDFDYTTSMNDQNFTFSGDDDVWVFLNNVLVLDIGGVHSVITKSFKLGDVVTEAGLENGKTYTIDLFHAERHNYDSNFSVTTSIPVKCSEPIECEPGFYIRNEGSTSVCEPCDACEGSMIVPSTECSGQTFSSTVICNDCPEGYYFNMIQRHCSLCRVCPENEEIIPGKECKPFLFEDTVECRSKPPPDPDPAGKCEVCHVLEKECNPNTIQKFDLHVVLDNSGSISDINWYKIQQFSNNLVDTLDLGPDNVRVGLTLYSDRVIPKLNFDVNCDANTCRPGINPKDCNCSTRQDVFKARLNSYRGTTGATYTNVALDYVLKKINESQNLRPDVPQLMMLMTDGKSTIPYSTQLSAQALRDKGVVNLAVGVSNYHYDELVGIVGLENANKQIFTVAQFDDLENLIDLISQAIICSSAKPFGEWQYGPPEFFNTPPKCGETPYSITKGEYHMYVEDCSDLSLRLPYDEDLCEQIQDGPYQNCPIDLISFCGACKIVDATTPPSEIETGVWIITKTDTKHAENCGEHDEITYHRKFMVTSHNCLDPHLLDKFPEYTDGGCIQVQQGPMKDCEKPIGLCSYCIPIGESEAPEHYCEEQSRQEFGEAELACGEHKYTKITNMFVFKAHQCYGDAVTLPPEHKDCLCSDIIYGDLIECPIIDLPVVLHPELIGPCAKCYSVKPGEELPAPNYKWEEEIVEHRGEDDVECGEKYFTEINRSLTYFARDCHDVTQMPIDYTPEKCHEIIEHETRECPVTEIPIEKEDEDKGSKVPIIAGVLGGAAGAAVLAGGAAAYYYLKGGQGAAMASNSQVEAAWGSSENPYFTSAQSQTPSPIYDESSLIA